MPSAVGLVSLSRLERCRQVDPCCEASYEIQPSHGLMNGCGALVMLGGASRSNVSVPCPVAPVKRPVPPTIVHSS
jgi:hypothetical protein